MNDLICCGMLEMILVMLICGIIGWLVLFFGQFVLDVVFWCCVFGFVMLLVVCVVLGFLCCGSLGCEVFLLVFFSGVFIVGNWVLLFVFYLWVLIVIGIVVYNVQLFMLVGLGVVFFGEKVMVCKLGWLGFLFVGMLVIVNVYGDSGVLCGDYLFGIFLVFVVVLLYVFVVLIVKCL